MSELWQRFQNEVKANGKKALLLAGLFLFGCCFWVPMLLRAVTPPTVAAAPPAAQSLSLPTASNPLNSQTAATIDSDRFWSSLAKSLADDPMYRSAEIESLKRDPFRGTEVLVTPPPVIVTQETKPPEEPKVEEKKAEKLSLNSTIIGRSRRAALINGQLYQLGRRIQTNGRNYLLTTIESHRVVLSSEDETIELTLARPQLKDVLDRGDLIGPDQQ